MSYEARKAYLQNKCPWGCHDCSYWARITSTKKKKRGSGEQRRILFYQRILLWVFVTVRRSLYETDGFQMHHMNERSLKDVYCGSSIWV